MMLRRYHEKKVEPKQGQKAEPKKAPAKRTRKVNKDEKSK